MKKKKDLAKRGRGRRRLQIIPIEGSLRGSKRGQWNPGPERRQ